MRSASSFVPQPQSPRYPEVDRRIGDVCIPWDPTVEEFLRDWRVFYHNLDTCKSAFRDADMSAKFDPIDKGLRRCNNGATYLLLLRLDEKFPELLQAACDLLTELRGQEGTALPLASLQDLVGFLKKLQDLQIGDRPNVIMTGLVNLHGPADLIESIHEGVKSELDRVISERNDRELAALHAYQRERDAATAVAMTRIREILERAAKPHLQSRAERHGWQSVTEEGRPFLIRERWLRIPVPKS